MFLIFFVLRSWVCINTSNWYNYWILIFPFVNGAPFSNMLGWTPSSSPQCSSVVQPSSKPGSYPARYLLRAPHVIMYTIGFLALPRLSFFIQKISVFVSSLLYIILINIWNYILLFYLLHYCSQGTWVSMGVYSDGSYGIQPGLIYSFPVTCEKGEWSIVQG